MTLPNIKPIVLSRLHNQNVLSNCNHNITGEFIELISQERVIYKWRYDKSGVSEGDVCFFCQDVRVTSINIEDKKSQTSGTLEYSDENNLYTLHTESQSRVTESSHRVESQS